MWHEARKQERKIRGIMVDFKRRADRRKEFYEKIKLDPTQFLRMYGRPVKIHLDPAVAMAAEGPQSMMPWQGDDTNMIDRFDVRANLDIIHPHAPDRNTKSDGVDEDERLGNYERYRTLVENEAAGVSEEQALHQIYLDEHFGTITKSNEEDKKKNADKKAAIGFVYEDSTPAVEKDENEEEDEESEEDIEIADLDVTIDVDDLTPDQRRELNLCATVYGMVADDFSRLLKKDKEELEMLKETRQLEEAKAQFSGRKSRRERRAINEKRPKDPTRFSRPSYAARESPKYEPYKRPGSSSPRRSRSRSRSSEEAAPTFITSFGAESDEESGVVQGPTLPATKKAKPLTSTSQSTKCENPWLKQSSTGKGDIKRNIRRKSSRSSSRSRSRSHSRSRRSRSNSKPKQLLHRTSKSSSRSISSRRSRSRSRSRSRKSGRGGRRSRSSSSRSRSRSRRRSRSKSRSPSKNSAKRSASPGKKPVVVKRYRRESLSSKSELSGLESDDANKDNSSTRSSPPYRRKPGTSVTKSDLTKSGKIDSIAKQSQIEMPAYLKETPKERLKRRMQAQLSRQFKADKKAEITKITKQEQERLDREEEIRSISLEIRRREREKRHKEREEEDIHHGSSSDSGRSRSPRKRSRSPSNRRDRDRSRRRDDRSADRRSRRSDSDKEKRQRSSPPRSKPPPLLDVKDQPRSGSRDQRPASRWGDGDRHDPRDSRSFPPRPDKDFSRPPPPLLPVQSDRLPDRRDDRGRGDDSWTRQRYGAWSDRPQERGDYSRRAPAGYNSNGRPRMPLLPRPRSPLMSRPRPPKDPSLLED